MPRRIYDVFICHSSEDKDAFVRPLAVALRAIDVSVWYDEFVLRPNDNLLVMISKGIEQSNAGLVVLSQAFFKKKQWPMLELSALLEKRLIFIWHDVSAQGVEGFFPPLASIIAFDSKQPVTQLAAQIREIVTVPPEKVWEDPLGSWAARSDVPPNHPRFAAVAPRFKSAPE